MIALEDLNNSQCQDFYFNAESPCLKKLEREYMHSHVVTHLMNKTMKVMNIMMLHGISMSD